jgi:hypothetical protein
MNSLLHVESLPHQNATQIKNKWGDVRRLVRQSGGVVITDRAHAEMVLVDAGQFAELTKRVRAIEEKNAHVLADLSRQFDERLRVLKAPGFGEKIGQVLNVKGTRKVRPKVGAF